MIIILVVLALALIGIGLFLPSLRKRNASSGHARPTPKSIAIVFASDSPAPAEPRPRMSVLSNPRRASADSDVEGTPLDTARSSPTLYRFTQPTGSIFVFIRNLLVSGFTAKFLNRPTRAVIEPSSTPTDTANVLYDHQSVEPLTDTTFQDESAGQEEAPFDPSEASFNGQLSRFTPTHISAYDSSESDPLLDPLPLQESDTSLLDDNLAMPWTEEVPNDNATIAPVAILDTAEPASVGSKNGKSERAAPVLDEGAIALGLDVQEEQEAFDLYIHPVDDLVPDDLPTDFSGVAPLDEAERERLLRRIEEGVAPLEPADEPPPEPAALVETHQWLTFAGPAAQAMTLDERRATIRMLRSMREPWCLQVLGEAFDEEKPDELRPAVTEALAYAYPDLEGLRPIFTYVLDSNDATTEERMTAQQALGRLP